LQHVANSVILIQCSI